MLAAQAVCLALAVVHSAACWQLAGGRAGIASPYPFLTHDHTFNYYYAVTARHFLRSSGTTAGYDPNFMAGYAKSILFPSSSTLPEVVVFLFGGSHPARAFKVYVLASAASLPWLMWLSGWLCVAGRFDCAQKTSVAPSSFDSHSAARTWSIALGLTLFALFFWTDWGLVYVVLGMVPFALCGPLSLLAMVLVLRYLERGGLLWWLCATAVASLAFLAHLSSAFVLVPGVAATYLWMSRRMTWKRHAGFWAAGGAVAVCNSFWVVPGLLLRSTLGTTATGIGFINPNVGGRMVEFFTSRPPVELTTVLCATVGLVLWYRAQRALFYSVGVVVVWAFLWGYLAGWFRALDPLQHGRYTLHFFMWGALPAGCALVWLAQRTGRAIRGFAVRVPAVLLAALVALMVFGPWRHGALLTVFEGQRIVSAIRAAWAPEERNPLFSILAGRSALLTTPPEPHRRLLERLRQLVTPGDRILFEERNEGIKVEGRPVPDPLGDLRLSPLIPLQTGAEVIGGPYLYTHLKTNFTQFGDGLLMGKPRWTAEQFRQYAQLYDVQWIVCWSPYARSFCRANPNLIEAVPHVPAPFFIGRVLVPDEAAGRPVGRKGRASVQGQPGKLTVRDIHPEDGMVVLPYHWVPRLVSEPPVEIEPVRMLDDPVPFIGLRNPPQKVQLWIDVY